MGYDVYLNVLQQYSIYETCVSSVSLYNGGEVNWEALGQEVTRCILKEVDSIAMIDKKYGNGSREPHDKADWR